MSRICRERRPWGAFGRAARGGLKLMEEWSIKAPITTDAAIRTIIATTCIRRSRIASASSKAAVHMNSSLRMWVARTLPPDMTVPLKAAASFVVSRTTLCISPGHSTMILLRTAYRTRAAEEERFSLRITAARCVSTVFRLMPSVLAIDLLLWPSAIN